MKLNFHKRNARNARWSVSHPVKSDEPPKKFRMPRVFKRFRLGRFGEAQLEENTDHVVVLNDEVANAHFPNNTFITSKYTWYNFIPKNFFEQLKRVANVYFVLITIMQLIPGVSPFPLYITVIPLTVILGATAVKEAYEDIQRHKSDSIMNNESVTKLDIHTGEIKSVKSYNVRVGDLIAVDRDRACAADMVVLSVEHTGQNQGSPMAWVDTAAMDGETRFKVRRAVMLSKFLGGLEDDEVVSYNRLIELKTAITSDKPNSYIEVFSGRMDKIGSDEEVAVQLQRENLILRGAVLRNTKRAWGVVVGAGPLTKLRLNQQTPEFKFSRLEKALNDALAIVFIFQTILCLVFAALNFIQKESHWNSFPSGTEYLLDEPKTGVTYVYSFLTWFILCSFMVPMSLYVVMEWGKFVGGLYISWDTNMYSRDGLNRPARPNTTSIVEELGQVEYVLSDKTGTLTDNEMRFIYCAVESGVFKVDYSDPEKLALRKSVKGNLGEVVLPGKNKVGSDLHEFLKIMTLCNELEVEENEDSPGERIYSGESPDEVALADTAECLGYVLEDRSPNKVSMQIEATKKALTYKILAVLPFTSSRKRMGIVLKDEKSNKTRVLYKGADNIMFGILEKKHNITKLEKHVENFSKLGLRTLVMASADVDSGVLGNFLSKYQAAQVALEDRDGKIGKAFEMLEPSLVPVGCSGVEDKLSDGVEDALQSLIRATVQVAVLTGDKTETAVSICTSCGLFKPEGRVIMITKSDPEFIRTEMNEILTESSFKPKHGDIESGSTSDEKALIISGDCLRICLEDDKLKKMLAKTMKLCYTTVCTRMTPMQKAAVTKLVKEEFGVVCLSIGDGGNDVSMIREADVGVGIYGKEGSQAVNSADFAIHKFADLKNLLFVHGTLCRSRIANSSRSAIFTNMTVNLPQVFFGVFSLYTGQSIEPANVLTFFNTVIISTCLIAMSCFGRPLDPEHLLATAQLYNPHVSAFSLKEFAYEMMLAFWVAAVGTSFGFIFGDVWNSNGLVAGMFMNSSLLITVVVLSILVSYALRYHCFTIFHFLSLIIGFSSFWIICFGLSMVWGPNATDNGYALTYVIQGPMFWMAAFLGIVIAITPQFFVKAWKSVFSPSNYQIIQEMLRKGDVSVAVEDALDAYQPADFGDEKRKEYARQYSL